MKRIMTLALVISLVLLPVALFAKERKGADIEITKKDGTTIAGELIAIRQNSTLLFESSSGIGESINVSEMKTPRAKARGFMLIKMNILHFAPGAIHPQAKAWGFLAVSIKSIKIVAESASALGGFLGILAGGIAAVCIYDALKKPRNGIEKIFGGLGAFGAGALAGGIFGAKIGSRFHATDKFLIEGKSPEKIGTYLKKLRSKARFPEYE